MDRITLLLQTQDLALEACSRGSQFLLNLPDALIPLCVRMTLNVIDLYDLETPEVVVQTMKRTLRQSVQSGNLNTRREANIVALFRAISDAPDDATDFADFALYWRQSKARDW